MLAAARLLLQTARCGHNCNPPSLVLPDLLQTKLICSAGPAAQCPFASCFGDLRASKRPKSIGRKEAANPHCHEWQPLMRGNDQSRKEAPNFRGACVDPPLCNPKRLIEAGSNIPQLCCPPPKKSRRFWPRVSLQQFNFKLLTGSMPKTLSFRQLHV